MTDAVLILTTWPAAQDPAALARTLVEQHLAACVNVLPPMQSTYRWKDGVETESERQLIIKTVTANVEAVRERLKGLHPYELPEFLVIPVAGGSAMYLAWLEGSTQRP
jgi:periplasmic divalent cation tolerance protein